MRPVRARPALLPLVLLVAPLLGGCLAGSDPSGATGGGTSIVESPADGAGGGEDVNATGTTGDLDAEDAAPRPVLARTLHLGADMRLGEAVPEAGAVTMGGSYAQCFATSGCGVLAFEGERLARDLLLPPQTVMVRYTVEASAPVAPGAFGFAAWFGTDAAMPVFSIADHSAPILPGSRVQVEVPIQLETPVVLPAGAAFRLYALSGAVHEASGILKLLVGGEAASSVTFLAREIGLPAPASPVSEAAAGETPAPGFPAGDALPEAQRRGRHAFVLGPNVTRVTVELKLLSSVHPGGGGDLDVDVYAGERHLAGAHTPFHAETVFLAGPALDGLAGGEITVVVSNFFSPGAKYEVVVTQS